jgi:hypothetical protein
LLRRSGGDALRRAGRRFARIPRPQRG